MTKKDLVGNRRQIRIDENGTRDIEFLGPHQTGIGWCAGYVTMVGTGLGIVQPIVEPNCTIDGEYGHKARWRTVTGDHKICIEQIDVPLPPTRKAKSPGNAAGSPVKK